MTYFPVMELSSTDKTVSKEVVECKFYILLTGSSKPYYGYVFYKNLHRQTQITTQNPYTSNPRYHTSQQEAMQQSWLHYPNIMTSLSRIPEQLPHLQSPPV